MEVNDALVDKLAHLARLKFDASEKEEIKKDLQKMIAFVEKLNELDTTGVEPLLHMSDEINVLRQDEIKGSISREDALIAHTRKNAYFVFQENNLGSLQPGKLADLLVLDRDYLTVPEKQIESLKALATMVGGRFVYMDSAFRPQ